MTQDLLVPAESEIVLEGVLKFDETVIGRAVRRIRRLSGAGRSRAGASRSPPSRTATKPIYHAINGYGRETVVLRKYVLEASLLKVLQSAVPIVTDAEMTAGGLHRFHAIVQVKKTGPTHDGLQRNAIMASFGALKDLDLVIVVDDDIDIRDPADVEYALATRMEASKDIVHGAGRARPRICPRLRTAASAPSSASTPPCRSPSKARFARCEFKPVEVDAKAMTADAAVARKRLDL